MNPTDTKEFQEFMDTVTDCASDLTTYAQEKGYKSAVYAAACTMVSDIALKQITDNITSEEEEEEVKPSISTEGNVVTGNFNKKILH